MTGDGGEVAGKAGSAPVRTAGRLLLVAASLPDSYGLVLGLLLVDVILSAGWTGPGGLVAAAIFGAASALMAFHSSRVRPGAMRVVWAGSAVAVLASVVAAVEGGAASKATTFVILTMLIVASPIAILARIATPTQVSVQTLLGVICVYIFIGLVFAYADLSVQLGSGRSFFAQAGHETSPAFVYYSFITMTTVGYGDLTPVSGWPRTMASLVGLIGQIFLVTVVARLVAMYTPSSVSRRTLLREEAAASKGDQGSPATEDRE